MLGVKFISVVKEDVHVEYSGTLISKKCQETGKMSLLHEQQRFLYWGCFLYIYFNYNWAEAYHSCQWPVYKCLISSKVNCIKMYGTQR